MNTREVRLLTKCALKESSIACRFFAKIFMQLRIRTHLIRVSDKGQLDQVVYARDALYDESVISLGEAAPVFNLRDIEHGGPTRGVRSKEFGFSCGRDHGETARCKPSLYSKGVAFLDQAIVSRRTALAVRGNVVLSRILLVLYVDEESDGFDVDICSPGRPLLNLSREVLHRGKRAQEKLCWGRKSNQRLIRI